MARLTALSMPSKPLGILDMMGPSTLEGGYSPSQVMSSYSISLMNRGEGEDTKGDAGAVLGAKATALEEVGTMKALLAARSVHNRTERSIL